MIFSFLYLFTFVKWSSKSIHIFLLKTHKLVSAGYSYSFQPCISTCISKLFSQRSCCHQLISTELLIFLCQNLPLLHCLIIMSSQPFSHVDPCCSDHFHFLLQKLLPVTTWHFLGATLSQVHAFDHHRFSPLSISDAVTSAYPSSTFVILPTALLSLWIIKIHFFSDLQI